MDEDKNTAPSEERSQASAAASHGVLRAILGPTASGKTALAVAVCQEAARRGTSLSGEVVSLDSMLVYRGLDIGTAKPSIEERGGVAHHLIDVAEPTQTYDVTRYLVDAEQAEAAIKSRGALAIFAGGTSFYLKALLFGLMSGPDVDPALRTAIELRYDEQGPEATHAALAAVDAVLAARVHPNDKKRVVRGLEVYEQTGVPLGQLQSQWNAEPRPSRLVGLEVDTEGLDRRILDRTRAMFAAGWAEEAERVRKDPGFGKTAVQALGYKDVLRFVDGELTKEEAITTIALRTRQFSRRQRTWLRGFENVRWYAAPQTNEDLVTLAPEVLDWMVD
ncbi:MAG: tRNA dimethylallyltransferase [Planctomycetota bacterium]|jgi:tRNA dimethylallyltransferase